MEHSKHLLRMVILVILVLIGFHIVRTLFTPASFGRYGHYRADNVTEQMAAPVVHGESGACAQCHGEEVRTVRSGDHASVECENCHGPLASHIKDGEKLSAMTRNRSYAQCLRCHDWLDARPTGFPQIRVEEHLQKEPTALDPEECLTCHQAHSPKLGH